jgi:hypothetical protein
MPEFPIHRSSNYANNECWSELQPTIVTHNPAKMAKDINDES